MSFLQWEEKLDVHVDSMNREHVELIRIMNKVHDASTGNVGHPGVLRTLDELVRYTQKHFQDEEKYMESVGFAGLRSHQLIHKSLLERVGAFVTDFKTSRAEHLPEDFFKFLKVWLVSHIQGVDTKYSAAAPVQHGAQKVAR